MELLRQEDQGEVDQEEVDLGEVEDPLPRVVLEEVAYLELMVGPEEVARVLEAQVQER